MIDVSALKALSVRQPWALAIIYGEKDIENRSRMLSHRGWTLIHASAGMHDEELYAFIEFCRQRRIDRYEARNKLEARPIERGGIVGLAHIVDCVRESTSPWWIGPCGLVIDQVKPLPFIPCRGTVAPLFWTPDGETLARVASELRN